MEDRKIRKSWFNCKHLNFKLIKDYKIKIITIINSYNNFLIFTDVIISIVRKIKMENGNNYCYILSFNFLAYIINQVFGGLFVYVSTVVSSKLMDH